LRVCVGFDLPHLLIQPRHDVRLLNLRLLTKLRLLALLLSGQVSDLLLLLRRQCPTLCCRIGLDLANLLIQPRRNVGLLHQGLLAELCLLAFFLRVEVA